MSEEQRHLNQFTETVNNLWSPSQCLVALVCSALLYTYSQLNLGKRQAGCAETPPADTWQVFQGALVIH